MEPKNVPELCFTICKYKLYFEEYTNIVRSRFQNNTLFNIRLTLYVFFIVLHTYTYAIDIYGNKLL